MKNKGRSKPEQAKNEKQYQKKGGQKTGKGNGKKNPDYQIWLLINESLAFLIVTKI